MNYRWKIEETGAHYPELALGGYFSTRSDRDEKIVFILAIFKILGAVLFPLFTGKEGVGFRATFRTLNRWAVRLHFPACL